MTPLGTVVGESIKAADRALRGPQPSADSRPERIGRLLLAIVILTPIYGAAMGSYGFADPERRMIALFAAIKTPMLLLVTTGLCLAPFLVLGHIARLHDSMGRALVAILSGQVCASGVLAALAPVTIVAYTAAPRHEVAILYNAGIFGIAALLGHRATRQRFRPLIESQPRHRVLLRFWCILYCFVGVQMGWTLRPFVGSPGTAGSFFREDSFTNAYVAVLRIAASAAGW